MDKPRSPRAVACQAPDRQVARLTCLNLCLIPLYPGTTWNLLAGNPRKRMIANVTVETHAILAELDVLGRPPIGLSAVP